MEEEKKADLQTSGSETASRSNTRNFSEKVMDALERSYERYPTGESLESLRNNVGA